MGENEVHTGSKQRSKFDHIGPSSQESDCPFPVCNFPRSTCCPGYTRMAVNGTFVCGITTTTPACPSGGTWSDWSTPTCNDTCGMCGYMISTRTCNSAPACPCTGSTQQIGERCANAVCKFPRGTCCPGYARAAVSGKFICQPSTGRKKRDIESEDDNETYETDEPDQQPSTSSYFSDILNNILDYIG